MKLLYQWLFIGLFYFLPSAIYSQQSIEFSAGYQFRDYFINNRYSGYTNVDLGLAHGANFELVAQFYSDEMYCPIRLGVAYSEYNFQMVLSQNSTVRSTTTNSQVNISRLEIQIQPANFKLKELEINLGLFFNILLTEEHQGNIYTNSENNETETKPIETSSSYGNYKGLGVTGRWSYNIPISKRFVLIPSYNISLGLSNDLNSVNASSRYLRQIPMVGIKYILE